MKYIGIVLFLFLISCHSKNTAKVIVIQPFDDLPEEKVAAVYQKIKQINPNTIIVSPVELPKNAFYSKRKRYRADSLLRFLNTYKGDTVVVGITSKDISTTKDKVPDWGVMGLGYRPGYACVVSIFRLSKSNTQEQFYKVVIHELGHTTGLPHCDNETCFMRDAAGHNHLDKETDFCPKCKAFLRSKGWLLN